MPATCKHPPMSSGAVGTATPMTRGGATPTAAGPDPSPGLVGRWRGRRGLILEALGVAWLPWLTARAITLFALGLAKYEVKHFHITRRQGRARIARRAAGVRCRLVSDHRCARLRGTAPVRHSLLPTAPAARSGAARRHLADGGRRLPAHHESGRAPRLGIGIYALVRSECDTALGPAGGLADHAGPARVRFRHGLLGGILGPPRRRLLPRHPARHLVVGRPLRVPGRNGPPNRLPPGGARRH